MAFPGDRPADQIGIVVRDLDAALARYSRIWSPGPWQGWTYGPETLAELTYRGVPGGYRMRVAATASVPQLELLQPLDGPSIYHEHLEHHGEGLHHLGFWVDSLAAAVATMESRGHACVQSGLGTGLDGDGGFAYFDTVADLGVLLEAIERPARRREPELTVP